MSIDPKYHASPQERNPVVLDLSHWNTVWPSDHDYVAPDDGFVAIKKSGVQAVILKATQGLKYIDPTFFDYVKRASDAGLLIAAYHFGTADDPISQAKFFESVVVTSLVFKKTPPRIPLILDFERDDAIPNRKQMRLKGAQYFLGYLSNIDYRPILYGGNYLREEVEASNFYFPSPMRYWHSEFTSRPVPNLPRCFPRYWLWQYTNRGTCPGVQGPVDMSHYPGTDLAKEWTP